MSPEAFVHGLLGFALASIIWAIACVGLLRFSMGAFDRGMRARDGEMDALERARERESGAYFAGMEVAATARREMMLMVERIVAPPRPEAEAIVVVQPDDLPAPIRDAINREADTMPDGAAWRDEVEVWARDLMDCRPELTPRQIATRIRMGQWADTPDEQRENLEGLA